MQQKWLLDHATKTVIDEDCHQIYTCGQQPKEKAGTSDDTTVDR